MKMNNRFIYGILSIVLAAVIAFIAIPAVTSRTSSTCEIVRMKAAVARGTLITAEDLELVEVGGFNLPDSVARRMEDVAGTYAAADARSASIILHDFCKGLGIPAAIYGHTEFDDVELYAYAEFDSIDNKDQYRLMDMSARSGNRDGAALRYVAERLMTRPEAIKLLIVISDGQPAADNYYGTEAEADLRGIKKEYSARGIEMFAAAIDSDKPNIQRIYGDGFLDITNLEKLPVNLGRLIIQKVKNRYAA